MLHIINKCLRLLLVLYVFVTCGHSYVFSPRFEATLTEFIEHTIQCRHVPGMTIAVIKGKEQWMRGFGKSDLDVDRKVNERTLFNIGSVTKAFTSTLLARVLNETNGKFNWTSKLADILGPKYRFVDDMRTQNTILRDILSHRTGLATADLGLMAGYPDQITREQLCRRLRFLPAVFPLRDDFMYNNFMYMLAGHVAEKIKEGTWEKLVTSLLLEPVGMTDTKVLRHPDDLFHNNSAKPYIWKDEKFENGTKELYSIYPNEPAGALLSNAVDMAKWMRFILNKGALGNSNQLVDEDILADTFKSHNHLSGKLLGKNTLAKPTFPVGDTQIGYGYAWIISSYRGYRKHWHSGGLFSYVTYLWIFPDMDIGIFASVNGPGTPNEASNALKPIFYYITDSLLGLEPWLNSSTSCTFPKPWHNETKNETTEETNSFTPNLADYSGSYGNHLFPDVAVVPAENGDLIFNINRVSGFLHPQETKDTFKLEIVYPWEVSADQARTIENNKTETIRVNFTRASDENDVDGFVMVLEANIKYTKGVSILDELPSGSSGHTGPNVGYVLTPTYHIVTFTLLLPVCFLIFA